MLCRRHAHAGRGAYSAIYPINPLPVGGPWWANGLPSSESDTVLQVAYEGLVCRRAWRSGGGNPTSDWKTLMSLSSPRRLSSKPLSSARVPSGLKTA